jgi:hypothetical protein
MHLLLTVTCSSQDQSLVTVTKRYAVQNHRGGEQTKMSCHLGNLLEWLKNTLCFMCAGH